MKLFITLLFIYVVLATDYNEIVQIVNNANTTWKATPVHNADHLISFLGVLESNELVEKISFNSNNEDIPESFDARTAWPECPSIGEIRDQSSCGSCWAVGAAAVATDRLCIASKGELKDRLSSQDLLTCCYNCGMGCDGGYVTSAWRYIHTDGITTGGEYGSTEWCNSYSFPKCNHHCEGKYEPCGENQPTPACIQKCQDGYPHSYNEDKHTFKSPYSPRTVEDIQKDLMTNGPQEVTYTVYEDFLTYKSGVYQHITGESLGGHAVKLIGWGVEDGTPYWLVANSWNEDWGDNGYFKILRGENHCGIEAQNIAALPNLSLSTWILYGSIAIVIIIIIIIVVVCMKCRKKNH